MPAWTLPVTLLALAGAAAASAADDLAAAVRACRDQADSAARLACYDRAAGRAADRSEATQAAPVATPAAAAPAPAPAEERFGLEHRQAAEEQQRREQEARSLERLEASVTAIASRRADGLLTISLDNGQVWRQNRPDSQFRLKVGDRVTIQPGAMKSFILSGPTNKSTRVTRVE